MFPSWVRRTHTDTDTTSQEMFVVFTFPKALTGEAMLTQTLLTFKWAKRSHQQRGPSCLVRPRCKSLCLTRGPDRNASITFSWRRSLDSNFISICVKKKGGWSPFLWENMWTLVWGFTLSLICQNYCRLIVLVNQIRTHVLLYFIWCVVKEHILEISTHLFCRKL